MHVFPMRTKQEELADRFVYANAIKRSVITDVQEISDRLETLGLVNPQLILRRSRGKHDQIHTPHSYLVADFATGHGAEYLGFSVQGDERIYLRAPHLKEFSNRQYGFATLGGHELYVSSDEEVLLRSTIDLP